MARSNATQLVRAGEQLEMLICCLGPVLAHGISCLRHTGQAQPGCAPPLEALRQCFCTPHHPATDTSACAHLHFQIVGLLRLGSPALR